MTRKLFLILSFITLLAVFLTFKSISSDKVSADSTLSTVADPACNSDLWQHVYTPQRLTIISPCVSVTGTIIYHFPNPLDGDFHIGLRPDPQYASFANNRDKLHPFGELVLETICQFRPLQKIPREACNGFSFPISIPEHGTHVTVTGTFVNDSENGGKEIHPVSSITPL